MNSDIYSSTFPREGQSTYSAPPPPYIDEAADTGLASELSGSASRLAGDFTSMIGTGWLVPTLLGSAIGVAAGSGYARVLAGREQRARKARFAQKAAQVYSLVPMTMSLLRNPLVRRAGVRILLRRMIDRRRKRSIGPSRGM